MGFNLKDYEEVKDRIPKFYARCADGRIITEQVSSEDDFTVCRYKALLYKNAADQAAGCPLSTGYAFEKAGSGGMANKGSHEENCETSAIGRALANAGFGGDKKRPSREEMVSAENTAQVSEPLATDGQKLGYLKAMDGLGFTESRARDCVEDWTVATKPELDAAYTKAKTSEPIIDQKQVAQLHAIGATKGFDHDAIKANAAQIGYDGKTNEMPWSTYDELKEKMEAMPDAE